MNTTNTISAPASPNRRWTSDSSTAARASSTVAATVTPLPAARPSAFTTMGAPRSSTYARAAAASEKVAAAAVGMPASAHTALRKVLEPSRRAAPADGPNTRTPPARRASARPSTRGCSGPTTTRPMPLAWHQATTAALSAVSRPPGMAWTAGSRAVPALPGAQYRAPHRGDWASFQDRACSRPPEPTTRTSSCRESGEERGG